MTYAGTRAEESTSRSRTAPPPAPRVGRCPAPECSRLVVGTVGRDAGDRPVPQLTPARHREVRFPRACRRASGQDQDVELDFEWCYRAVDSRDGRFDGWFYTAVTSTGLYCRPSWPARPPHRHHLRFYRSAAAAHRDRKSVV